MSSVKRKILSPGGSIATSAFCACPSPHGRKNRALNSVFQISTVILAPTIHPSTLLPLSESYLSSIHVLRIRGHSDFFAQADCHIIALGLHLLPPDEARPVRHPKKQIVVNV